MKSFSVVARTLSFSRAADLLNIAQPALSRQIKHLEEQLDVLLFDRQTRSLKLTNAGSFLFDQSILLLDRVQEVAAATRGLGAGSKRWMGVGFVPTTLYGFLPNVLRRFADAHHDVELTLSEMTSIQQAAALKARRIDIGFGRVAITSDGLENTVLRQEAHRPVHWRGQIQCLFRAY